MTPSIYDIGAPKLWEKGYFPLPIAPGTKAPHRYTPSEGIYELLTGWTERPEPILTPQPGAGIGVRMGDAIVALDWDHEDAAIMAMEDRRFPPTVTKEGSKGFTAFYRTSKAIPSRDFKINGGAPAVQMLSDGRQTVIPDSVHPETGRPYHWSSKFTLYDVAPEDLPELPDNYVEIITDILAPFGYVPEPERPAEPERPTNDAPEGSPHWS